MKTQREIETIVDALSRAEERSKDEGNYGAADAYRYAREALEWALGGMDSPLMDDEEDPEA